MQNTTNYGLKKPESTDYINISDLNDNADIIDEKLKENADELTLHKNDFNDHLVNELPHIYTDATDGKKYKYGFKSNNTNDGLIFVTEEYEDGSVDPIEHTHSNLDVVNKFSESTSRASKLRYTSNTVNTSSSSSSIDHTHNNLDVLNKFSESKTQDAKLQYDGKAVVFSDELTTYATKSDLDSKVDENTLNDYATKVQLDTKVSKEVGKSLLEDTEIQRLKTLTNYDDSTIKSDILKLQTDKADKNSVHEHLNISTLEKLTESGGKLKYDNNSVLLESDLGTYATKAELTTKAKQTEVDSLKTTKADKTELNNKVDKVQGKSLISDTEITRLASVKNYDDTDVKADIQSLQTDKADSATVQALSTTVSTKANIASPSLSGTPTAPTASAGTNNTQIATTAFVTTAINNKTSVSGNAGTATKLQTARTIELSGDVSGTVSFDGSANAPIKATLASSGVSAGSYGPTSNTTATFGGTITIPQVTVDAKGRVTSAAARTITLPSASSAVDTKVTNELAATTKAYVTGTTTATTSTGTQVFDTGVYLDTTAGMLTATTFKGTLSGNATTATTLATSRTISLTGDVTGSASFNGGANATITTTVADNSHNHTIANVTNLQSTLDAKATRTEVQTVQTELNSLKISVNQHLSATMPHTYVDDTDGQTYKYGLKPNSSKDGLIFIYEEA